MPSSSLSSLTPSPTHSREPSPEKLTSKRTKRYVLDCVSIPAKGLNFNRDEWGSNQGRKRKLPADNPQTRSISANAPLSTMINRLAKDTTQNHPVTGSSGNNDLDEDDIPLTQLRPSSRHTTPGTKRGRTHGAVKQPKSTTNKQPKKAQPRAVSVPSTAPEPTATAPELGRRPEIRTSGNVIQNLFGRGSGVVSAPTTPVLRPRSISTSSNTSTKKASTASEPRPSNTTVTSQPPAKKRKPNKSSNTLKTAPRPASSGEEVPKRQGSRRSSNASTLRGDISASDNGQHTRSSSIRPPTPKSKVGDQPLRALERSSSPGAPQYTTTYTDYEVPIADPDKTLRTRRNSLPSINKRKRKRSEPPVDSDSATAYSTGSHTDVTLSPSEPPDSPARSNSPQVPIAPTSSTASLPPLPHNAPAPSAQAPDAPPPPTKAFTRGTSFLSAPAPPSAPISLEALKSIQTQLSVQKITNERQEATIRTLEARLEAQTRALENHLSEQETTNNSFKTRFLTLEDCMSKLQVMIQTQMNMGEEFQRATTEKLDVLCDDIVFMNNEADGRVEKHKQDMEEARTKCDELEWKISVIERDFDELERNRHRKDEEDEEEEEERLVATVSTIVKNLLRREEDRRSRKSRESEERQSSRSPEKHRYREKSQHRRR